MYSLAGTYCLILMMCRDIYNVQFKRVTYKMYLYILYHILALVMIMIFLCFLFAGVSCFFLTLSLISFHLSSSIISCRLLQYLLGMVHTFQVHVYHFGIVKIQLIITIVAIATKHVCIYMVHDFTFNIYVSADMILSEN